MITTLKRKPLKGKTKKRHEKIETDWKIYTSSSNELNSDIKNIGKDKFKFEILKLLQNNFFLYLVFFF